MCISNTKATSESESMKKLSNTKADLKKSIVYKKSVYSCSITKKVIPVLIFLLSFHHILKSLSFFGRYFQG